MNLMSVYDHYTNLYLPTSGSQIKQKHKTYKYKQSKCSAFIFPSSTVPEHNLSQIMRSEELVKRISQLRIVVIVVAVVRFNN